MASRSTKAGQPGTGPGIFLLSETQDLKFDQHIGAGHSFLGDRSSRPQEQEAVV